MSVRTRADSRPPALSQSTASVHSFWRWRQDCSGLITNVVAATVILFGCSHPGHAQNVTQEAIQQIEALHAEKAARTPTQQKIDSQLIYAAKEVRGEVIAGGRTAVTADVQFLDHGEVEVDIKAKVNQALLDAINRAGGTIAGSYPAFDSVRARMPVARVEDIASLPAVISVRRAVQAITNGIVSQGDATHRAATARGQYFATGAGVKIGVLSDSVDSLANAYNNGELSNVTILPGQSGMPASGEGTAMLEIIRDLAPAAELYYATAFNGPASFAQNILNLRAAGCDIIVDDVMYWNESPFQEDIIAQAVNAVTAGGAIYFSSAGNSGNVSWNTSGTWEGNFFDGGDASGPVNGKGGRLHRFGSLTYNTCSYAGSYGLVNLFWADPLGASSNDYDVYVLDAAGNSVLRSSTTTQNGTQDPWEFISTLNTGERIVVVKASGEARFLHLDSGRGYLAMGTGGSTRGHSAAAAAFCVAAVNVNGIYPNAFSAGNRVESFSSDGPRRMFFDATGAAFTPGNFLATGGIVRQKPDLSAADGVSTSVAGFAPFYGTSAAAPHAAAIAALLKSYNPSLTPAQVRTALLAGCIDMAPVGADSYSGAGILMATSALQAAPAPLPAPQMVAAGFTLVSEGILPTNSQIDAAEIVTVEVGLKNVGSTATNNLTATLLASDGVSEPSAPKTYGVVEANGSTMVQPFTFRANGALGGTNKAKLQLTDGSTNLGVVEFTFGIGAGITATSSHSASGVTIVDKAAASPYPANLTVSGASGIITDLSVTISGFSHTYPADVSALLVGPSGQAVVLLGAAGGGTPVNGVTLTLSDSAAAALPSTLTSGTYRPGGSNLTRAFSSPAPTTPYSTSLSALRGATANGIWKLYVQDFGTQDVGSITGWSLSLTTSSPGPAADGSADLAVTVTAPPKAVRNANQAVVATVRNVGPATATDVVMTYPVPAGATLNSVSASQGSTAVNGGVVTASIGTLTVGATATVTMQMKPTTGDILGHVVRTSSAQIDANHGNNLATLYQDVGTLDLRPYKPSDWSDEIIVRTDYNSLSDSPITTADGFYVSFAVLNDGALTASPGWKATLYLDEVVYATGEATSSLNGYYYFAWNFAFDPVKAGLHWIRVVVDSDSVVSESDETNNEFSGWFIVSGPNRPNLAPYQPSQWYDKLPVATATGTTWDSSPLLPSNTLYVDWAVVNHGPTKSNATFYNRLYVDDVLRQTWSSEPPLDVGYLTYVNDYSIGSLTTGTHTIKMVVDATNTETETNEADNEYVRTIVVGAPTLTAPGSNSFVGNPTSLTFNLPQAAQPGSLTVTFSNSTVTRTLVLAAAQEASGTRTFSFNPGTPLATSAIASITGGERIPSGVYNVTLSYRDTAGNGPASAASTNVTLNAGEPSVSLAAATGLTATSATLNGSVNARGRATTVQFEYGATDALGSVVAATLSPNNSTTSRNVSAPVTGLIPGVPYRYRLSAASNAGTTTSAMGTFTLTGPVSASFASVGSVPVTAAGYTATGQNLITTLGYAPLPGAALTVVNNSSNNPINGTFSSRPEGSQISLTYNSTQYIFTISYAGGDGNDIVLTRHIPHEIIHAFERGPATPERGELYLHTDGNFYGVSAAGGAYGCGTLFRVTPAGSLTTLIHFSGVSGPAKGASPNGGVTTDASGNLWGTCSLGGAANLGTIFKFNPVNLTLVTVAEFTGTAGATRGSKPMCPLASANGFWWGATTAGGTDDRGVVFRINQTTNAYSVMVDFTGSDGNSRGSESFGGLVNDGMGFLWGTTRRGGLNSDGVIFKISIADGTYAVVKDFNHPYASEARIPEAPLALINGVFWGSTAHGGASGRGTIFQIDPITHDFTSVLDFGGKTTHPQGVEPYGKLVSDGLGFVWGTTKGGGFWTRGNLFKIEVSTGTFTSVTEFLGTSGTRGNSPLSGLTSDGNGGLWGTTSAGGYADLGTIYRVAANTGVLSTVVDLNGNSHAKMGAVPLNVATIRDGDGVLWGTTSVGGESNEGTLFKISGATGPTTLVEFTGRGGTWTGQSPGCDLTLATDGHFYGVTKIGGLYDQGTVFRITKDRTFTSLVEFTGNEAANKGSDPTPGSLIEGHDGMLYGTTSLGGSNNHGTVFKVSKSGGSVTTLGEFSGTSGALKGSKPSSRLTLASDGNLYGTTSEGGTANLGTVFKVSSSGIVTPIFEFTAATGTKPSGALVEGTDGLLYGTSEAGGASGFGTTYKVSKTGSGFATVVNCGAAEKTPRNHIRLPDGNLYGVSDNGGLSGAGCLYRLTTAGQVTPLLSFTGTGSQSRSGAHPSALRYDPDGNLYGTTSGGGSGGGGTVYRVRFGPTPVTLAASNLGPESVMLNGTVNANGISSTARFEWGTSPSALTQSTPVQSIIASITGTPVSATLTGLQPYTTYYFRVRGDNIDQFEPQYGEVLSFTTSWGGPQIAVEGPDGSGLAGTKTVLAWGSNNDGQTTIPAGLTGVQSIAAGSGHTVALKSDGTVVAWGENDNGQTTVPAGLTGVGAIAAGANHTVALKTDGTVVAWGNNTNGQCNVPAGLAAVKAIAAGGNSTFAIEIDGTVVAWGSTSDGHTTVPPSLTGVTAIASNGQHTLARKSDGTVVAWGSNSSGQTTVPAGLSGVIAVAAGADHSVALKQDGTVVAWGSNTLGQLNVPVGLSNVTAIAASVWSTLALKDDGTVVAWGSNSDGITTVPAGLANATAISARWTHAVALARDPVDVGLGAIIGGASSSPHTFTIRNTGAATLNLTGLNFAGTHAPEFSVDTQGTAAGLAPNASTTFRVTFTPHGAGIRNAKLRIGSNDYDDTPFDVEVSGVGIGGPNIVVEGSGSFGSQSLGTSAVPTEIVVRNTGNFPLIVGNVALVGANPGDFAFSTAGFATTISPNGGSTINVTFTPTAGGSRTSVLRVSSNDPDQSVADIALTGTGLGTFSATFNSSADTGLTIDNFTATGSLLDSATLNFAPTPQTTLTLVKNTGDDPIVGTLDNLRQWQRITLTHAGIEYAFVANYFGGTGNDLVLQWADVRLVAWGRNGFGELGTGVPSEINPLPVEVLSTGVLAGKTIVAVATGTFYSLALCSDGTIASWGYNNAGQLGDGTLTNRDSPVTVDQSGALAGKQVIHIAAGGYASMAVCSDGTVFGWGQNTNGALGNGSTTDSNVPVAVDMTGALGGKKVIRAAICENYSLFLCSDGTVAGSGSNGFKPLGIGAGITQTNVPLAMSTAGVLSGKKVIDISAGSYHSLMLCSDGTVAACGRNDSGQLGDGTTTHSTFPVGVVFGGPLAGQRFTSIAAGALHSMALAENGKVAAWGGNNYGQLGNTSTINSSSPITVDASGILAGKVVNGRLATGHLNSFARCIDGTLVGWGANYLGHLADGTTTDRYAPVAVDRTGLLSDEGYLALSSGQSAHSLGLIALRPRVRITTLPPSALTETTATLNATVRSNGSLTSAAFEIGSSTAYGTQIVAVPAQIGPLDFSQATASATNLTPGATYHYRAKVVRDGITTYGADVVFVALSSPRLRVEEVPGVPFANGAAAQSFGISFVGNPTPKAFTIRNVGTAPLSGLSASIEGINPGSFAIASPPPAMLPPGASATVIVHMLPLAVGAVQATVHLTSNDSEQSPFIIGLSGAAVDNLQASFNAATDIPLTTTGFGGAGSTVSLSLNYPPAIGTELTIVNNTGWSSIASAFDNLAHGQVVLFTIGGLDYKFVVNYYGGTGNDLVLQWAHTRLIGWGDVSSGQIGNGNTAGGSSNVPVFTKMDGVLYGKAIVALSCGIGTTVALCSDGTLAKWGGGITTPVAVPMDGVLTGKRVVAISCGISHNLVLCSDGTMAAWGTNTSGELGNGTNTSSAVPVAVSTSGVLAGKSVVAIAAGSSYNLALCSDQTLVSWGSNGGGKLGYGGSTSTAGDRNVPVAVDRSGALEGKTVSGIAACHGCSFAVCTDGTVAGWGGSDYGVLGVPPQSPSSVIRPMALNLMGAVAGKQVTSVGGGSLHSLFLCSDRSVAAAGSNYWGQLGNPAGDPAPGAVNDVPLAVVTNGILAGKTVILIDGANYNSLALCSDGTIATWGYNGHSELGTGLLTPEGLPDTSASSVPVAVSLAPLAMGERVISAACGVTHSMAIVASPPPESHVVVEQPAGTAIPAGSGAVSFATNVGVGESTTIMFTVRNTGNGELQGLGITFEGPDAANFAVGVPPSSAVVPGGSTTFTVRFTPAAAGLRSATLRLASNDRSTPSYDIALAGRCLPQTIPLSFASASEVAITSSGFTATGYTLGPVTLGFAAPAGTILTIVNNTGSDAIAGTFTNLAQGTYLVVNYDGVEYQFQANYMGGTGNDVTLALISPGKTDTAWPNANGQVTGIAVQPNNKVVAVGEFTAIGTQTRRAIARMNPDATLDAPLADVLTAGNCTAIQSDGRIIVAGSFTSVGGVVRSNIARLWADGTLDTTFNPNVDSAIYGMAMQPDGKIIIAGEFSTVGGTPKPRIARLNTDGSLDESFSPTINPNAVAAIYAVALQSNGQVVIGGDFYQIAATACNYLARLNADGSLDGSFNPAPNNVVYSIVVQPDQKLLVAGDFAQIGANSRSRIARLNADGSLDTPFVDCLANNSIYSMALQTDGRIVIGGDFTFLHSVSHVRLGRLNADGTLDTRFKASANGTVAAIALQSDGKILVGGVFSNLLGGFLKSRFGRLHNDSASSNLVAVDSGTVRWMRSGAGPEAQFVMFDRSVDGGATWDFLGSGISIPGGWELSGLQLTGTGLIRARARTTGGQLNGSSGLVEAQTSYNAQPPELAVLDAFEAPLVSNESTVDFGTPFVNNNSEQSFQIVNSGLGPLGGVAIEFDGVDAANWSVVSPPASSVAPNGSSSFRIRFTPHRSGTFEAAMEVRSNDPNHPSFHVALTGNAMDTLYAAFDSPSVALITSDGFVAAGNTITDIALNYAPAPGGSLTVVRNTGLSFINGTFGNLTHGQRVSVSLGAASYQFVANYFGGTGNDLVLEAADTRAFSWGENDRGQLGIGTMDQTAMPTAVTATGVLSGKTVTSLAQGASHSLALCSDGTVTAWGGNDLGQLGNGTTSDSSVPITPIGALFGKTVVALSAGARHSVALCSDGKVFCWGDNVFGQLGDGTNLQRTSPVETTGGGALAGKTVVAIAAGAHHSLALCSDGTIVSWGQNQYGQLGVNHLNDSVVPVAVVTDATAFAGKTAVAIATGGHHSAAICSDGSLVCWGRNNRGQLGDGTTVDRKVPSAITSGGALASRPIAAVCAGLEHTLLLCSDGMLFAFGSNDNGQLGDSSLVSSGVPVAVNRNGPLGDRTVVKIATGAAHSVALCSDGALATWGSNTEGQLGVDGITMSLEPGIVFPPAPEALRAFTAVGTGASSSHQLAAVTPAPPELVASTLPATDILAATSTLNGMVNAKGNSAFVFFEYGTDSSYGGTAEATPLLLTDSTDTSVAAGVSGLTPGTTYHYRVNAVSESGVINGEDATFRTLSNVAALSGLTVSEGSLVPAFSPEVYSYTLAVPAPTTTLTVTPTAADHRALISIKERAVVSGTSSSALALGFGPNPINLVVRAEDGTTETYELVVSRGTAVHRWMMDWFGSASGDGEAGFDADANHNGIANLLEYSLDGDPLTPSSDRSILPQGRHNADLNALEIAFTRHPDRDDVTLTVEGADSPSGPWEPLAESALGAPFAILVPGVAVDESPSDDGINVTVIDAFEIGDAAHPRRFLRLRATLP